MENTVVFREIGFDTPLNLILQASKSCIPISYYVYLDLFKPILITNSIVGSIVNCPCNVERYRVEDDHRVNNVNIRLA